MHASTHARTIFDVVCMPLNSLYMCVHWWKSTFFSFLTLCSGRFSLDPNRVLDILLEAFECQLEEKELFVPLLQCYPCEQSTFVNILGFKFQAHQVPRNHVTVAWPIIDSIAFPGLLLVSSFLTCCVLGHRFHPSTCYSFLSLPAGSDIAWGRINRTWWSLSSCKCWKQIITSMNM